MQLVSVYGTLKQGHPNHRLLEESELMGTTRTTPSWTMYSLGFCPCVSPHGDTAVEIEVYKVDEQVFSRLDMLEGYPSFYDRKRIDTEYGESWMYFIDREQSNNNVIESGVWV